MTLREKRQREISRDSGRDSVNKSVRKDRKRITMRKIKIFVEIKRTRKKDKRDSKYKIVHRLN